MVLGCSSKPVRLVGDGPADEVKSICERTVRWALNISSATIFNMILTRSSRSGCSRMMPATTSTPSRYSTTRRIRRMAITRLPTCELIMNIDTGAGTLVHEIVLFVRTRRISAHAPLGSTRDWGRFTNIAASAMCTSWRRQLAPARIAARDQGRNRSIVQRTDGHHRAGILRRRQRHELLASPLLVLLLKNRESSVRSIATSSSIRKMIPPATRRW